MVPQRPSSWGRARVLVLGGGGREHALAWRLARDPEVERVFVAPGNGGTDGQERTENRPLRDPCDLPAVRALADELRPELVVIGPEAPLLAGVADALREDGHTVLGPNQAAAFLEGSKRRAKAFMERHGIPTARARAYPDVPSLASELETLDYPLVLKASGLAAGKGVVIVETPAAAREALAGLGRLDGARDGILAETFLRGRELSYFILVHGQDWISLPPARDYKRLRDGDQGPNTGGMGAASPPELSAELEARIVREIVRPTLEGLAAEALTYVGFLYFGLMIDPTGRPYVLEYNCRLGDPEAQVILPRLGDSAFELFHAVASGRPMPPATILPEVTVGVVVAAPSYPEAPDRGRLLTGFEEAANQALIFHAGTRRTGEGIVTDGGRILCLTGRGHDLAEARERAYAGLECLVLPPGLQFRHDVARTV